MGVLIGLSGKKRSGKDTVADRLVEEHGFVKVSFAAPLKEMLYALNPIADVNHWDDEEFRVQAIVDELGWDVAKDRYPEIRQLLQRLGTEAGRQVLGNSVWVDLAMRRAVEALDGGAPGVVIPDARFVNEADAIESSFVGAMVRIERAGLASTDTHPSEVDLDDYPFFYDTLHNDSTIGVLHEAVDALYDDLLTDVGM